MANTSSPFGLEGRVAVIIGGNRGIGRSIALAMARAGAAVAILSRNEEKNSQVLAELKAIGGAAVAISLDVTERKAHSGAIAAVEKELGPIDILVNNAGVATVTGGILNESPEVWDTTLATHLDATFLLSKLAAASMVGRKRGKIINLASMYSYFGAGMLPSYGAAKGAISATDQGNGRRVGASWHSGQCNRARLDCDRDDGAGARESGFRRVQQNDPRAHTGRSMGRG
jgi:NAD(P)-dependent dehydrogenase (short-subunit alcohol dehydrogenase family)